MAKTILVLLALLAPPAVALVHEQIGRNVDLSSVFKNHLDQEVTLSQVIQAPQPLLLIPVELNCGDHCWTHLRGVLDALKRIRFVPGMHFQLVLLSTDPSNTVSQAADLMQTMQRMYGRRFIASGWSLLTASEEVVQLISTNLGLSAHVATAIFLDSNGRIVRYLEGPSYTPTSIKAGLIEAGQDQMGSMYERFVYSLSQYNAKEKRYKLLPVKTLAWITLPLFVLWLTVFTVRDFLSKRR